MVEELISGRQQEGLKQGNEGNEIMLEYFGSILLFRTTTMAYTYIITVIYYFKSQKKKKQQHNLLKMETISFSQSDSH